MRSSLPIAAVLAALAVPVATAGADEQSTTTTSPSGASGAGALTSSGSRGESPGSSAALRAAAERSAAATPRSTTTTSSSAPALETAPTDENPTGATDADGTATTTGASPTTADGLVHPEDPDAREEAKADQQAAKKAAAKKRAAAKRAAATKAAARKAAAAKAAAAKAAKAAKADAADEDATDGEADSSGDISADALLAAPDTALSKASLANFRIPLFLLPIYQAAGTQYGVRWEVLAAINEIETDYGRNLNVSTAGAQGWMQFMPATWKTYGTDATGDGKADPYNPADGIFAAARYLKAAGAEQDIAKAIFAYNHADWYVQDVLKRAKAIAALPTDVVGSLTGLSSAQQPVYADGVSVRKGGAKDWAPVDAKDGSPVVAVQDGTVTRKGTSRTLGRWIEVRDVYGNRYTYAHLGDLAEQHLVPRKRAKADDAKADDEATHDDGAQDAGGDAEAHEDAPTATGSAPTSDDLTVRGGGTSTTTDPAPTEAATAGRQGTGSTKRRAATGSKKTTSGSKTARSASSGAAATGTGAKRGVHPMSSNAAPATSASDATGSPGRSFDSALPSTSATTGSSPDGRTWMWSEESVKRASGLPVIEADADALAPLETATTKEQPDATPTGDLERYQVRSPGLRRSDLRLSSLRTGSRVTAGTVLGRTGSDMLRFAVRPAGSGAPRIDPRPVLEGWERLEETTAAGDDAKKAGRLQTAVDAASASDADAGSLLLLGKSQLQQRVLGNPRLEIYASGRDDIRSGQIDRRVLATLEYLTADGTKLGITSLRSGHSTLSSSGNVSAHSYGSAVDIASVDGTPISGHQGAGSITETTIRRILRLQGAAAPNQIISLMTIAGAPSTMSMADHADHIHVGFPRAGGSGGGTLGAQVSATLQPSQWPELVDRLAAIENPDVREGVSKAATTADDGD